MNKFELFVDIATKNIGWPRGISWNFIVAKGSFIKFPEGFDFTYENSILYFKVDVGMPDSVDFSNAKEVRKVFECFWQLKKGTSGNDIYTVDKILNTYKKLHHSSIERYGLSHKLSNLRKLLKHKPNLVERFSIEHSGKDSYLFTIK